MQAPMTRVRLITLSVGVLGLAGVSYWRLSQDGPPPPVRPAERAAPDDQDEQSPPQPDPSGIESYSGRTMGTTYSVKYVPPHPGVLGMPEVVTEAALSAVNESMSTYDRKSEVSKFNRAGAEQRIAISEELLQVISLAQRVHDRTRGAFDITVRPLVSLYGFGATPAEKPPTKEELSELHKRVGMNLLEVRPDESSIQKLQEGVELDLGGIAKGFGVDQVALALEKLEITNYMIEVGGEIRVRGKKNDGNPWKLAIEEPSAEERKLHATLSLPAEGGALATSGDYRNFREVDGRVISHTFDPRALEPTPRRTASVSVIRPTAAEADALATALSVLSPKEAIELSNEHGWAVYVLVHGPEAKSGGEGPGFIAHSSEAFGDVSFDLVKSK